MSERGGERSGINGGMGNLRTSMALSMSKMAGIIGGLIFKRESGGGLHDLCFVFGWTERTGNKGPTIN